jgi:lipopolysaccharide assembly protein B
MDFDLQWLLIAFPVAFALGWMASRFDLKQLKRERDDSPRAYFKGLNLLLNEKQDQAIDAFIEAVQSDPDTAELHFALGNLFRRRGEFERAIRVHQHLLGRADLKAGDRDRAQLALAQDFMKAGLFDRAEAAWHALQGTAFNGDAQLALLSLFERSHDWPRAAAVARKLQAAAAGSNSEGSTDNFAARIAHYECEAAEAADRAGDTAAGDAALLRAEQAASLAVSAPASAPTSTSTTAPTHGVSTVRVAVLAGHRQLRQGHHAQAVQAWDTLRQHNPQAFLLVAEDYAAAAHAAGQGSAAHAALESTLTQLPAVELLRALEKLEALQGVPTPQRLPRLLAHLKQHPSLSAAQGLLAVPDGEWTADAWTALRDAVARSAKPLQRYRCAVCGFEAQRYFWQCPGCLTWDSYPTQRIDAQ